MSAQRPQADEGPLAPTATGVYCSTTHDALTLVEAVLSGTLRHVPRRPHDKEREAVIQSGSVFVYSEDSAGIKRWTDGKVWSPSRIKDNFLLYREMDKPFTPGEKKRALKKKDSTGSRPAAQRSSSRSPEISTVNQDANYGIPEEALREYTGSLTTSYPFKKDGLMKKTISVNFNGQQHHLVSYYHIMDAYRGALRFPTQMYPNIIPRRELMENQAFRNPIEESIAPVQFYHQQADAYHPGFVPYPQQQAAYHQHHQADLYTQQHGPYQQQAMAYQPQPEAYEQHHPHQQQHLAVYHQPQAVAYHQAYNNQQPQPVWTPYPMDNHPLHPSLRQDEEDFGEDPFEAELAHEVRHEPAQEPGREPLNGVWDGAAFYNAPSQN
ncbi:Gti1/Pac2 family-domain-containing protein [Cercophora newfieldiana]|uniref:Gti1/Pac2 family-domain-containing protein n=1 Tax=Cercophora newfieldiana TaxID=92897 RepID=A0AA39Y602_9PEZI|nr:Gti1/Pac2 family-domain-containing protein [Cercophora newfieldiana]